MEMREERGLDWSWDIADCGETWTGADNAIRVDDSHPVVELIGKMKFLSHFLDYYWRLEQHPVALLQVLLVPEEVRQLDTIVPFFNKSK